MKSFGTAPILSLTSLLAFAPGCAQEAREAPLDFTEAGGGLATVQGSVAPDGRAALIAGQAAGPATAVRVVDLSSGSPTVVGQGAIADGGFSVDVPASAQRLIVTAVDGGGNTAASGILDVAPAEGEVAQMAALGPETTLEAEAATDLVECLGSIQLVDTNDLRARLTELVATAALTAIEAGASVEQLVDGLAQAIGVAQATELASLAGQGVPATRQALFESGLPASLQLQRDLTSGVDPDVAARTFAAGLQAARGALVGKEPNGRAQVASAIAFAATAEEEEGGLVELFEEIDAVIDAVLHAAVEPLGLEALVAALDGLMDPIIEGALGKVDELIESLGLGGVFEGPLGELVGTLTGLLGGILSGDGILGDLLGLGGLLGGHFDDDILELAQDERDELVAEAVALTEAAAGAGECIDVESLGGQIAAASDSFSEEVRDGVFDRADLILIGRPSDAELTAISGILSLVNGLQAAGL
jgi:hypothetical protein